MTDTGVLSLSPRHAYCIIYELIKVCFEFNKRVTDK